MMIGTGKELAHLFNATRFAAVVAGLLARHSRDVLRHGRATRLTNGNALAARLAKSAFDGGVPLWTSAPARELVVEDGAVRGAVVEREGRTVRVRARRGVVLAAGGFPQDAAQRRSLFRHAPTGAEHWSPAPPGNTGDGLRLGEAAGAAVEDRYPNDAAWVPISLVPWPDGGAGTFPHFVDGAKPGVIAVTAAGERFTNEANSYHDFIQAMVADTEGREHAAWLLCDHTTLLRCGAAALRPRLRQALAVAVRAHLRSGYLKRGRTLAELAAETGIEAAALERTVAAYNEPARRRPGVRPGEHGLQPQPGRPAGRAEPLRRAAGARAVLRGEGGARRPRHLRGATRRRARAGAGPRRASRPGLYAAGNDLSSVMGGNHPGGGITLWPAMTFGWIAAHHLAGRAAPGAATREEAPAAAA